MTSQALHRLGSARTAAQWTALLFGLWFTVGNYVAGTVIWPGTITDPNGMYFMHLFGFIPVMVNGWHLYFHLITGLICLLVASSDRRARIGCGAVAAIYLATGIVGLVTRGDIYGLIMADTFGNGVHVVEGTGLALGAVVVRPRPLRALLRVSG
ncbi:DUF4383 domain-containing protein [Nocardioides baekrokdamisoli]|nr:DUF4383 domain-containing protein [Nocardioides baekrokdamisoli]